MHQLFSYAHHLIKPGIHSLVSLLQDLNQILCLFGIVLSEESISGPSAFGPGRTTNTVYVVLSITRKVEIDDKLDVRHICLQEIG